MSDRPAPAHRGIVAGQVAEIIVTLNGGTGQRGSGYRVGPAAVLTAAHVVAGAVSVRVRFDADLPGEWSTDAVLCWTDPRSDLAVLTIPARQGESPVTVARCGRISDRAAVLAVRTVGFPRFKLKTEDGDHTVYRDSHQADGSVAVLSNRREGTLEVTVPPPERDPDPATSPWEGMSGAAVWVGDRIVGVLATHHRSDGLGRLAAARLDLALEGLDATKRAELRALLSLPDVLPDVVPPSVGDRVTTAYQAQVRDIAPECLLDREAELDELVGFCAADQPYAWWQAGPWAGKSALMSSFVLHPPAGVDVVSFFVTARLAGQSDSDACTDALIEQLAALLGESPAGLLTAGARRGTLLRLLDDAANRAREAGHRLLLVIDGLDEDSGTCPSIAALLPRRPPADVRVLVASRPHPPVPDDVAEDHPLRTISPRRLDVSEHARDVERRAKHELTQLLAGQQLQRDVLGLITAAGGGLSLGDLEQLTERPPFEIERLLGGVFGRSVGSRTRTTSGGHLDERVYLFTHETLRLVAEQQYGTSLAAYRDRLHTWADTYRQRGWPAGTPQYLLRSYPRMLAGSGDLPRLVACATDQARHDRMRNLTGGDALALTEISTAQQRLLAQPDPDLTSLALLNVQREHLTERNSNIPINLPAVWAELGQPTRAEALANSIPDPYRRAQALVGLVQTAATHDDHTRATRLTDTAETLTAQITEPYQRAEALAELAQAAATHGDHTRADALTNQITSLPSRERALAGLAQAAATHGDHTRAETLTDQITDPHSRARALVGLAQAAATHGDHTRATRLADTAETLTVQITDPHSRARALVELAQAAATHGDHTRATRLADTAETLTDQITEPYQRAEALAELAQAAATHGDHTRATQLADTAQTLINQIIDPDRITDLYQRAKALAKLAQAAATHGDHTRADALTNQITDPDQRARALAELAQTAATHGDHTRADALTNQITNPHTRARALAGLAQAAATHGDHTRADALTNQITDPDQRAAALAKLAQAAATHGDHTRATRLADTAETLTDQITDPHSRVWALVRLAQAAATHDDHTRATRLADTAHTLTDQITDPHQRAEALAELAQAAANHGDHTRADALTNQITNPHQRARALAELAQTAATHGDHTRATQLADTAETLTVQITDPHSRARALVELAQAAATHGDHTRATRLADTAETLTVQITDPHQRAWALVGLAQAAATHGDHTRADALTNQITNPHTRTWALVGLAQAAANHGDHTRADALTNQITNPHQRSRALAGLAQAAANHGDHTRADALTNQITNPHQRSRALAGLAQAAANDDDHTRAIQLADTAETLTDQITNPHSLPRALTRLAGLLAETCKETSAVPEHTRSSSPLMVRTRRLLGKALVIGSWRDVVAELARVDSSVVAALADDVQSRWELDFSGGR